MLLLALTTFCGPPPQIENAETGNSRPSEIGEMVLYACVDGFTKVGGDSRLTCTLSKDSTAIWSGESIECSSTTYLANITERKYS